MAIILKRLTAIGRGKSVAEINFHPQRCLIRGPSDTGKSYVRDCLWYLLGGDKPPKSIPQAEGYESLSLEFSHGDEIYEVRRAIAGGASALSKVSFGANGQIVRDELEQDEGEFLVKLAGADERKILRSMSKKGDVTGGDLRHWFLLSQPDVISEDKTSGVSFQATQRVAAFHLFLTGSDDAAIELRKSSAEVERVNGQLGSAEESLIRAKAVLPENVTREEVVVALDAVDTALAAMTGQYEARAAKLRDVRRQISEATDKLNVVSIGRDHSASMVERFKLLDSKYSNDLQRLGAVGEGVAFFSVLPETPCPLCGTPVEKQIDPKQLRPNAPDKYRQAIASEAAKILQLRHGLLVSLEHERHRHEQFENDVVIVTGELESLEHREAVQLSGTRVEFTADPKTLAIRRSELVGQLSAFDEIERLKAEIERLRKSKVRRKITVSREAGDSANAVASYAKVLLNEWGFHDVTSVGLDTDACDLLINGRARLNYGAGKRAIFLTALTVSLLKHALSKGHPHLGVVVIDSPLKAYADPMGTDVRDVAVTTVTEKFYGWLSNWTGPGQIVILENEEIRADTAKLLQPIQFSGVDGIGRIGFYPAINVGNNIFGPNGPQ